MMKLNFIKDILLNVIQIALKRYSFDLIKYQIMDNHVHLIIRTRENGESISRIMQYIKSRMAERYNKIMNRTGPFWNERFKDEIIEFSTDPNKYLNLLKWHLAYEPVRRNKVDDPRKYEYGCINVFLNEKYSSPVAITFHEYYINLGNSIDQRIKKFLKIEHDYRTATNSSYCR